MGAVLGLLGAAGAAGAAGTAAAGTTASAAGAGAAATTAAAASGAAAGAGATAGLANLATGAAGAAGTAAKAGAVVNPLATLSWDNVGNAISDLAKTTKTGRTFSTLTKNDGFSWENTKEAVSDLAQEALRERFEQNGIAGRAAVDALNLKGGQNANKNTATRDGQAAVETAADPSRRGVYGQFGAAPPVQAPRQTAPAFNAIDYYNSLMGNKNGQSQA